MLELRAAAKINLTLQILGKRLDGFHEIDSIMQSVSLYDKITLSEIPRGIRITSNLPDLPINNTNTAFRAAKAYFDRTGLDSGVIIYLEKQIPVASGLAGGSADAAATLIGLNRLFKTGLSESDIQTLAAEVGSDVAFCTLGGTCRCRGRGELIEKIEPLAKTWLVLVVPGLAISTKWVYDNFDLVWLKEDRRVGTHKPLTGIDLFNDLERVVAPKYPVIAKVKQKLVQLGCLVSQMSGSGSAVFGIAPDQASAENIAEKMRSDFNQVYVVESVGDGVIG